MAFPESNLKKTKKMPLPGQRNGVPFRNSQHHTCNIIQDTHSRQKTSYFDRQQAHTGSSHQNPLTARHETKTNAITDQHLMSAMMSRLSSLEIQLLQQSREISEKDKRIAILEEKLEILQKAKGLDKSCQIEELKDNCMRLQNQVHEMEDFLTDYGMVWVGTTSVSNHGRTSQIFADKWDQAESQVSSTFHPDYDLVIKNIAELNVLAGEGIGQVVTSGGKATLKMPDSVPLTLYANGIAMFAGPFRSFEEPTTRQCLKDISDGYFPSDMQQRYPDGIPFQVTDRRWVTFKESGLFTGPGKILQNDEGATSVEGSSLSHTTTDSRTTDEVCSELPGHRQSTDQFLSKLPSSVIKGGQVIDIRNSIGELLKVGSNSNTPVIVLDTEAIAETRQGSTCDELTTLRVIADDKTCLLKMRLDDTIGQLRKYLDAERPAGARPYVIMSTFPSRVYADDSTTLKACGLFPNFTLHLRCKK